MYINEQKPPFSLISFHVIETKAEMVVMDGYFKTRFIFSPGSRDFASISLAKILCFDKMIVGSLLDISS